MITSGPQFIYWLLDTVCRAINLRTAALTWSNYDADVGMIDDVVNVQFYLSVAHLVLSAAMLLLNCFADKMTDQEFLNSRQ